MSVQTLKPLKHFKSMPTISVDESKHDSDLFEFCSQVPAAPRATHSTSFDWWHVELPRPVNDDLEFEILAENIRSFNIQLKR